MSVDLYPHQRKAVEQMHNGCILCGDVGTGKSRTALAYYQERVCADGAAPPLYIVTTARKRDTMDWEKECEPFCFLPEKVDSWQNVSKYVAVKDAFFIFDEQRVSGKGKWVKSFLEIAKHNQWILLSATPGDTWMDYVPVFVANGYYRRRSDFIQQHVVYNRYNYRYPMIDHYIGLGKLIQIRKEIVVTMPYQKKTVPHDETVWVPFDQDLVRLIFKTRWNPFKDEPIADAGSLCLALRQAVNSDPRRMDILGDLMTQHDKAIVFYNFDYELDALKKFAERNDIPCAEWNGHQHEPIPSEKKWIYLVQYAAGAEGWNCIETDTMIFFSQNYSYKSMTQAAGRIDRLNTPYTDLYYYHLISRAPIDMAIRKAIQEKRDFNASLFLTNS